MNKTIQIYDKIEAKTLDDIYIGDIVEAMPRCNAARIDSIFPIEKYPTKVYGVCLGQLAKDYYLQDGSFTNEEQTKSDLPLFQKGAFLVQTINNGFVTSLESFGNNNYYLCMGRLNMYKTLFSFRKPNEKMLKDISSSIEKKSIIPTQKEFEELQRILGTIKKTVPTKSDVAFLRICETAEKRHGDEMMDFFLRQQIQRSFYSQYRDNIY